MIKRIELWDFESHEHTIIDDVSPALSLICGESNSGKTSIVRALKLVAYNDFDLRSVRVGATKCVVQVDTERGRVKVTRGEKNNLWEVTKTGRTTQYFDKVGKNVVPEAAEIIGLNIITLGDVQIPVNIMDQLESHFMLSGVGDKDATGSMRAQIVDEISGLSGIEGLIKDVSLDHHRYGRETKETEKQMEAVRSQLHPEADLNAEKSVLEKAGNELADHETMVRLIADGETIISEDTAIRQKIGDLDRMIAAIPDTDYALRELATAEDLSDRVVSADSLFQESVISENRLAEIQNTLAGIPDVASALKSISEAELGIRTCSPADEMWKAWDVASQSVEAKKKRLSEIDAALLSVPLITDAEKAMSVCGKAQTIIASWESAVEKLKATKERIDEIGNTSEALNEISRAQELLAKCSDAANLLNMANAGNDALDNIRKKIDSKDLELKEAEKERDEILATIKTCPLTLKPVSKECVEGVTA
jgi:exonuclease SbcC